MDDKMDARARLSKIQERHAEALMNKANVVGVGIGRGEKGGAPTDELCLVVMVEKKVPLEDLPTQDRIPAEIDGVRVDVRETGVFTTQ